MRLKDYARNPTRRKEYVQQSGLLLGGIDVSKTKDDACLGPKEGIRYRKFTFTHSREGFQRFETVLRKQLEAPPCQRTLIAMEPSGISWHALYDRLRRCGYGVCLGNCQAVPHNRKTMHDGASKTDAQDAQAVCDLLQQGTFFLPDARDLELQAAYRLMRRHMALKKRVGQLRHQLRAALHLSFPALNPLIKALPQPTSLRFLQANPTPHTILRNGRRRFVETGRPRRRCGQ
jgi:transposase